MHSFVLIVGDKKSGKTFVLEWLVERHRQKGAHFLIVDTMGHWRARASRPGFHVVNDHDPERIASRAVELTEKLGHGVVIVLDEAWQTIGKGAGLDREGLLYSILRTGRQPKLEEPHFRRHPVCVWGATQQPKDLFPEARNLADRIYFLKLWGPESLDWALEVTHSKAFVAELPKLKAEYPHFEFRAVET